MGWEPRKKVAARRGRLAIIAITFGVAALALGGITAAAADDASTSTATADPATQQPVETTAPPTTQPPDTQPPVTEPPVTEPPVTEPPVTQPPDTQPSDEQTAPPDQQPKIDYGALAALDVTAQTDLTVPLNNDTANPGIPGVNCPSDGLAYWHFIISPNNGHSAFVQFHLELGDGIHNLGFIPNGSQQDNVFVQVPAGYDLTDIEKTGSTADITWDGVGNQPTKFVLSHLCGGTTPPPETGSITVTKNVENGPAGITTFTVHVKCDGTAIDADLVFSFENGTVTPPSDGFSGIPFGTVCKVTEPNPPAGVTPIFNPAGAPDPGVTIDGTTPNVTVTVLNSFPSPEIVGSVSVTKHIGPGGTPADGTTFSVHVVCTDGTDATLTFTSPNDLGPKQVPVNIPQGSGTTCTVEETNAGANVSVSYDPPDAATSGFLLTVGVPSQPVTVTNSFTEVEPSVVTRSTGGGTTTGGTLAFTGSSTGLLVTIAVVSLGAGAFLVLVARRRRRHGGLIV